MSHVSPNTQEVVGLLPDCAIPFPRLGCLTFCACKAGNVYQTEKGGVKTSELLVVDRENGILAIYDTLYDALSLNLAVIAPILLSRARHRKRLESR
jgi:hypothetical protein